MRSSTQYALAAAFVSLCSASPLAELAEKNDDCGFKPSTTYKAGDAALTSLVDKARITGSLRDTLLQGGWSPIDGCTSWCCKCAATVSDSPDYYPTACRPAPLAPVTTAPAQLELRDVAFQTRTLTRGGSVIYVPMINFADMATACGFGHNTAGACEPASKVIDIKVTRTLADGMLFISDELSTQYATAPTNAAAPLKAPIAAPFAAPAPQISPGIAAPPKPFNAAPFPGLGPAPASPIVTIVPVAQPAPQAYRPVAMPPFAGDKPLEGPPSLNDKPPFGAFGGVAKMPLHYKVHGI